MLGGCGECRSIPCTCLPDLPLDTDPQPSHCPRAECGHWIGDEEREKKICFTCGQRFPEIDEDPSEEEEPIFDKWDARMMAFAEHIATWSKDTPGVGAVIVDSMRRVHGLGYNGFPRNIEDTPERLADDVVKNRLMVHAETNAVLNGWDINGCAMYTTRFPCTKCSLLIIQSGICRVVTRPPKTTGKWADDAIHSQEMLEEAGVMLVIVE